MWRKHKSVFQDHLKYTHNDIMKPFMVRTLYYDERIHNMHNTAKDLPPLSMKGYAYEKLDWTVHNK